MYLKNYNNVRIIGIDHGYGNIKTANDCFPAGILQIGSSMSLVEDLLVYANCYYTIGVGHKEFLADKFDDNDYYVLTLAAIAMELRRESLTRANVLLAVGLPLTWVSEQKTAFRKYLLQNEEVEFTFRRVAYHVRFVGCEVYPQGFAAIAQELHKFSGAHMLCDIGNGTMNILHIFNRKPDVRRMFTEKYGTQQCALAVREHMMRKYHAELDDNLIHTVLRCGNADISLDYIFAIAGVAKEYTEGIFRRLRERGYDSNQMRLYVVGGGSCLVQNFGTYDKERVTIRSDVCAMAKGYEYMAELSRRKDTRA